MKFCWKCGSELVDEAEICPKCGVRVAQNRVIVYQKSKIVAALLAIFLGGLGLHKFYLNRWTGILYLLFCWTLIPSIIGFVEGIIYLLTSDEEFAKEYNTIIKLKSI